MLELNHTTNKLNLYKRKMLSICLIAISYVTIIFKVKDLASVRYPEAFVEKIAYFLGMIVGVSVVPLLVSFGIVAFNKYIRKKDNTSFLLIFSFVLFLWVIFTLIKALI